MSVERKYTWFAAAVAAAFLVFSAVIILLADGGRMCSGSDDEPVFVEYAAVFSPTFPDASYYMTAGSTLELRLAPHEEIGDDTVITWSSSEATVARVDGSGTVTALADGTAVITADTPAGRASVTVFVADDLMVAAVDCVRGLSLGCDSAKLQDAQLLLARMEESEDASLDSAINLLQNIISYTETGSRETLEQSISACEVDSTMCRTAAVCCWAYGEQQRCEGVLSFAGDCTLARFNEKSGKGRFPYFYERSGSLTYPFDRAKGLFACDDVTLINFEGTLTRSTRHQDKEFYFRGDPEYAAMLPASSIEAAGLANNHSLDYHRRGYDDTVYHLTNAGVTAAKADSPTIFTLGGQNISVVILSANLVGTDREDALDDLTKSIQKHKNSRSVVVINLHWGTESTETPAQWQRDAAHRLIDEGADLIVGHHPHVAQGLEMYKERYIAYSLGNFSFGGNMTVHSPETFILRARVGMDENGAAEVAGISIVPCMTTSTGTKVNNYQPKLCFGMEGDGVYSELIKRSEALDGVTAIDRPDI